MSKHAPLAYDIITQRLMAGARTVARFTCSKCGQEGLKGMPATGKNNPEAICNWFNRDGWRTDINSRRLVRCPQCAKKKRPAENPHKEIERMSNVIEKFPQPTLKELAAKVIAPSPPTNEQRRRIREKLDEFFDDAVGRYIDGYSDQKIGELLSIPWASVKTVREAAYGDLRGDPEIEALRRMQSEIKAEVSAAAKAHEKAVQMLDVMAARLKTIEQRMGIGSRA